MTNPKTFIWVSSVIAIALIVSGWFFDHSSNLKLKITAGDLKFVGWVIIVLNLILIIVSWQQGKFP